MFDMLKNLNKNWAFSRMMVMCGNNSYDYSGTWLQLEAKCLSVLL